MIDSEFDYMHWDTFIRKIQEETFKVHFKQGILAKNVSFFGSGFALKKDEDNNKNLHTVFEVHNSSTDAPNSFTCKISNEMWKGNYMARDNRDQNSSTFGYNGSGGEKFMISLESSIASIVPEDPLRFYARIYLIAKGAQKGTVFGLYSNNGKLMWGPKELAEAVEISSNNW